MRRPVTERCVDKGCPHLAWESYRERRDKNDKYKRRICLIEGKPPCYLMYCPLEVEERSGLMTGSSKMGGR